MNNFKLLYGLDIPHKSLVYNNNNNNNNNNHLFAQQNQIPITGQKNKKKFKPI
jgi:hypothetical protein